MHLSIDHVTLAGSDLEDLRARVARLGLDATVGGVHDDGTTHMAAVVFADGTYLELVAPTADTDPADAGYWPDHLAGDPGPAAWCVRAADARDVACEAVRAGFAVNGPTVGGRTTPDGRDLEWTAVTIGGDVADPVDRPGEALPFVCEDRTPRVWRVPPDRVHAGPIVGIDTVLVAVDDPAGWLRRFRRLAAVPAAVAVDPPGIAGTVRAIPGAPLALVEPDESSSLADRLERFGPGPCGYLLSVTDVTTAREAYPLDETWEWLDGRAAWMDEESGVLGVADDGLA